MSCVTARAVLSPLLPSPHGSAPQERHGRMLLHQTTPWPIAAALAGCGSGNRWSRKREKTPAQCLRSPILPVVMCVSNPGKDTSRWTSVSSQTSASTIASRSRWPRVQRPSRFHVPIRTGSSCPMPG